METKHREMPFLLWTIPLYTLLLLCSLALGHCYFMTRIFEDTSTLIPLLISWHCSVCSQLWAPRLLPLHKVPLFQVIFWDTGWEEQKNCFPSHSEERGGFHRPKTMFDRDPSQNSLLGNEFYVITWSPTCMRISSKEFGNLAMVPAPEMWVTEEKMAN